MIGSGRIIVCFNLDINKIYPLRLFSYVLVCLLCSGLPGSRRDKEGFIRN